MFWAELGAKVLGAAQKRCRCILGSQKLRLSAKLTSCCKACPALWGSCRATRPSAWPGPFDILSTYKHYSIRRVKMVKISLFVANCETSCGKKDCNVSCTRFHVNALHVTYIRAICMTSFEVCFMFVWFIIVFDLFWKCNAFLKYCCPKT